MRSDDVQTEAPAPMKEIEGKVAFITGGDSGIGLGIARVFVSAGMKVVITYRSRSHLVEAMDVLSDAGGRVHAIAVDVTDRVAMAAAAEEAVGVFGKVHVLISNAGVAPLVPLSCATYEDWDWCMNVNVNGVFNSIRSFLPHIGAHQEGGQIVATSSMLGGVVVGPFWGVYSTSKFAVVGMMEALRSELASTNIGVSVFCPAAVSSNLRQGERNRPQSLAETGATSATAQKLMQELQQALHELRNAGTDAQPAMNPIEAGERVLRGIRNNDLYILSHAEYEPVIRERSEALLASVPDDAVAPSPARVALAKLGRSPVYAEVIRRKTRRPT